MVAAGFICCFRGSSESRSVQHIPTRPAAGARTPAAQAVSIGADPRATSRAEKPGGKELPSQQQQAHQSSPAPPQWAYVLNALTEAEGPWLQKLQNCATVLQNLVPGGMVSLSAVLGFGSAHVPLAATGHGSKTLAPDLWVPCTMVLAGEEMSSVERLLAAGAEEDWDSTLTPTTVTSSSVGAAAAAGINARVGVLTSHDMQQLPPDWQALASQHGLRSFMCLPLTKSRRMLGVLTLACPHAWPSSPLSHLTEERQAALAALVAQPMLAPELWVACGLLHSLSLAGDIEQVVRAVCSATAQLCTSAYYQTPTCRLALLCQDAPSAVVFELDGSAIGGRVSIGSAAPNSPAGSFHRCSTQHSLAHASRQMSGNGGVRGRHSGHGAGTSLMKANTSLALGAVSSTGQLAPQALQVARHVGEPSPLSPQGMSRRARSVASDWEHAPGAGPHSAAAAGPASGSATSHMTHLGNGIAAAAPHSFSAGSRQTLAHGHALELRQTLLGAAVEAPGAMAWLPDCTNYVQEGHAYLHDQVISKANRTVASMVVAMGKPCTEAPPLLAAYCTFRTPQPDIMLESLGGRLREMMQVAAPLVWHKLQREMAAEWQLLHLQAAERLRVGSGGSRRAKPRKAATQPDLKGCTLSPGQQVPVPRSPLLYRASPRNSLGGELSPQGGPTSLGSNHGPVLNPRSNCGSAAGTGSGPSASGPGSNHGSARVSTADGFFDQAGTSSLHHPPLHELSSGVSEGLPSFTIEKIKAGHSAANKMAPIMAGVHDKLMQMQMSRLLYGSAQDHQEELEAIIVLRKIGEGGFASVHHGKFHGLDVAIKIMKQGGGGGGGLPGAAAGKLMQTVDMLNKATEVAVMFSVSHPNIVQVMTFFTDVIVRDEPLGDGSGRTRLVLEPQPPHPPGDTTPPYCMSTIMSSMGDAMAAVEAEGAGGNPVECSNPSQQSQPLSIVVCMELCDMGTLWRAVCKGAFRQLPTAGNSSKRSSTELMLAPPNLTAIYHTLLEVALALRHLHSLSLVHCDLKASNVLLKSNKLDPRGFTCKLSDFGLVKLMAEDEEGNVAIPSDISSGTLTHMAPEIFSRRSRLTSSVDIYAFGIMMYEIIMGQLAYKGMQAGEATRAVVFQNLRPKLPVHVPQDYSELAEACWHCDPAQRPDSSTLVNVLEALLYTSQKTNQTGDSSSK